MKKITNSRIRAKKLRRRKVAQLAAYSVKHTVNNCTIPKVDEKDIIKKQVKWGTIDTIAEKDWLIPKDGFPQPKRLRKKYKKKYYCKGTGELRKIVSRKSDWDDFPDHTFHPGNSEWYMEQVIQHKIAKWEKKSPCPVKPNQNPPDMFEEEFVTPWKALRDAAIQRIRGLVTSRNDKLPLTGRFQESENNFKEEKVADIKDEANEGNRINELNPKTSPLLKKAQKITNKVKAKRENLVCTNLKDHKREKGRLILPKAALEVWLKVGFESPPSTSIN